MNNSILPMMIPLLGVVVGALLAFFTQYLLRRQQDISDIRKKAIDVKTQQCLAVWNALSDTYRYLFFSGCYSASKIDIGGLGEHLKGLNITIIKAEPFVNHQNFLRLMEVRDTLNQFFIDLESSVPYSYEEHMAFVVKMEGPMGKARDVLREELQLVDLGIVHS